LCRALRQQPLYGASQQQVATADNRLRAPVSGLAIIATVNLLVSIICLFVLILMSWYQLDLPQLLTGGSQEVFVFRSYFTRALVPERLITLFVVAILAAIFASLQFYAWYETRKRKEYWVGIAGFISAVIPAHPGWVLGLPIGIWGLIVMGSEASYAAFEGSRSPMPRKPVKS